MSLQVISSPILEHNFTGDLHLFFPEVSRQALEKLWNYKYVSFVQKNETSGPLTSIPLLKNKIQPSLKI